MKAFALFFSILSLTSFSAFGTDKTYDIKQGGGNKIEWLATGTPGFLKINAEDAWVVGTAVEKDGMVSGDFKVKMAEFTTGLDLRDDHMKNKYLEVAKYPFSFLRINPVKKEGGAFSGMLTIKNETKPVSGKFSSLGGKIMAEFTIALKDYPSIGVPGYLGITMADKIDVKVEFPIQ